VTMKAFVSEAPRRPRLIVTVRWPMPAAPPDDESTDALVGGCDRDRDGTVIERELADVARSGVLSTCP